MAPPLPVTFCAGRRGEWRIERIAAVAGEALPAAERLSMRAGAPDDPADVWRLRGVVSNTRYTTTRS